MAEEIRHVLEEYIKNVILLDNIADLDEVLCSLVDDNKDDEDNLKRVVLTVYQLLQEHKWQVENGDKMFRKMVALLTERQGRGITALILSCIKAYVIKFPNQHGDLLEELWSICTSDDQQPQAAQIVIQMFDCFVGVIDNFLYAEKLHEVIRQLLVSEMMEDRKAAHQIMRKLLSAIEVNNDDTRLIAFGWSDKQQFLHSWSIYVAMWEQLELEPTAVELDNLKEMHHKGNSWWLAWLNLLQTTLLAHDNISLNRKTLHYFMENYNFAELNESLQKQFLLAVNNVELYNVDVFTVWLESNIKLPREQAFIINPTYTKRFLKDSKVKFFEAITTIEWNSVPLHFWLQRLKSEKPKRPKISKELLMKLAAVVRQVESKRLRGIVRCRLLRIFKNTINILNSLEYIEFCEALYNINDGFYDHYNFWLKLERTESLDDVLTRFSKRFYQIISNRIEKYKFNDSIIYPKYSNALFEHSLKRLAKLRKEQHGWLRFFIVFDVKPTDFVHEFCRTKYDLDLLKLRTASLSLNAFCKEIEEKLVWQPDEETDLIRQKCVDLYVEQRLKKWSDLSELRLNPIEPLSLGTWRTLAVFLRLIENHDTSLPSDVLPAMIETLKRTCIGRNDISEYFVSLVFKYAQRNLADLEIEKLTHNMLNVFKINSKLTFEIAWLGKINQATLIRGLLHGEPTVGSSRIEEAYGDCFVYHYYSELCMLRGSLMSRANLSHINKSVYDELLRINNELPKIMPYYHENSKVHLLKIRIAMGIFNIYYQKRWPYWTDELWTALLTDFDHDNIRYLYELMIVYFAPDLDILLKKLRETMRYNASQQVSLMSVVFTYCMINYDKLETSKVIVVLELLQSLIKDDNFQIRLHAQLFSYCLILKTEENNVQLPQGAIIKKATIDAYGNKMEEYLLQPRFNFPDFCKRSLDCLNGMILYVTNAPFDECAYWDLRDILETNYHQYFDNVRKAYVSNAASNKTPYIAAADDINLDFGEYDNNMTPVEEIIFRNRLAKTQM